MRNELGVMVGVDGSMPSEQALRWAAAEASVRRCPLTICQVWEWPYHEWPGEVVPLELARRPALRDVKRAAAWTMRHQPGLVVNTVVDRGAAADVLVDLSWRAQLVVVGTRGHGRLGGLVVGSVGPKVAAHAACPVVVVRGRSSQDGSRPVVVGFDGTPASVAALRFAVDEASSHRIPLKVMIAYRDRGMEAGMEEARIHAQSMAWDELDSYERRFPDLEADVELVDEPARPALLAAAEKASLLVVGRRGLGELRGLLLGSVSLALVHHATCPVAVVHQP